MQLEITEKNVKSILKGLDIGGTLWLDDKLKGVSGIIAGIVPPTSVKILEQGKNKPTKYNLRDYLYYEVN